MQFDSNHSFNHKSKSSADGELADAAIDPIETLASEYGPDVFVATGADARRIAADLMELRDLRRRRAGGSIFKRARSSHWQLKYPVGDGWRYESSGTTDKRTAQRLLAFKVYQASAGILPGTATFEQAIELLLNDARVRGLRSVNRLRRAGRALLANFAGLRAKDVNRSALLKYAADRQQQCAPDTVKFELEVARRALRLGQREGWITALPDFPRIEHLRVRAGFFDSQDWSQVREHLRADFRDAADFAFMSGWRQMEVLDLKWSNVDFRAVLVRLEVGSTKSGAGRVLPFGDYPQLAEVLERRQAVAKRLAAAGVISPWVFCFEKPLRVRGRTYHAAGSPLFKPSGDRGLLNGLRDEWNSACGRAGFPGRMFHDLRRSAARNFERADIPRSVARRIGGWSDKIYSRYAIGAEKRTRRSHQPHRRLHRAQRLALWWHSRKNLNKIRQVAGGGGRESNPPATVLAAKPILKTGGTTGPLPPPRLANRILDW
jgi:integrase